MAKKVESADWADRYAAIVAQQVRHYRNARGMSAQKLSDACAELGHPIHRSVLANFENGRRATLDLGELLVIAMALDVPPVALMLPDEGSVEVPGGRSLDRASAAGWIAGTPDPAALNEAAADLARAQGDAERAHRRVEEASRRIGDILGADRSAPPREQLRRVDDDPASHPNTCTGDLRPEPGVREPIDAALEHLGRLDSETMTETERTLAAALRSVCVAVMHKAADAA